MSSTGNEKATKDYSTIYGANITIRRAVKEDCQSIMELVNELAVYEKAPDEVTVAFDHFVESGFGEKPVWWAFVAEASPNPSRGGEYAENKAEGASSNTSGKGQAETEAEQTDKIVGFALYYIRYSTWKGQRLYLEDLVVTEDMRGKGIGKLLFDQLITEAKEKKFSGMMWQVLDWNEPASNFYKKFNANLDGEWINGSLNF